MIILDTNVVSEAVRPRPDAGVVTWLESLTGDVAITAITLAELLAGVRRVPAGRRKTALASAIDDALAPYRGDGSIVPFDDAAADRYAHVVTIRERAGRPISTADAQIAAICLVHDATLATRNTADFAETGVQVVNPWDAR